ncbi:MAG: hypothetical protein JWP84_3008 [Tardiphaga sp.]|nr:hypothetical protein [Tardiphaga sp.]
MLQAVMPIFYRPAFDPWATKASQCKNGIPGLRFGKFSPRGRPLRVKTENPQWEIRCRSRSRSLNEKHKV